MVTKEVLTWPGNGVYTVNTAKEKKEFLIDHYYQTKNFDTAEKKWLESFNKIESDTFLLGAPSDCGAGIQRGSNWGPLAIREHFLKSGENRYFDLGDIRVVPHLLHDKYLNDQTLASVRKALYQNEKSSLPVSPLSQLQLVASEIFKTEKHLFTLGGDHSISFPLVSEWLLANKNEKVGVLHFDAHTDLLEERLGIDYCFGSWVPHALRELKQKEAFVQVGIRSTGKSKQFWEKEFGLLQFWSDDVKAHGACEIGRIIKDHYKKLGVEKIYLSFDIDTFDIDYASATGTPEAGGIDPSEALQILGEVTQKVSIQSADLVEVAPNIFYPNRAMKNLEPLTTLESANAVSKFLFDYWNNGN